MVCTGDINNSIPHFPDFKPLQLRDRSFINNILWQYQPETSELTFTNLFIWRYRYHYKWSILDDWLLLISENKKGELSSLEPIGPPSRIDPVYTILKWLNKQSISGSQIERADNRLVNELMNSSLFSIDSIRDHYDYVYATNDLINLGGRAFHSKRNHLTRFFKKNQVDYLTIKESIIYDCLELSCRWCSEHQCIKDPSLCYEKVAIEEALVNLHELNLPGAAISINGRVEAFTLGEMLNDKTAVIHVEKASSQFHGIYTAINQMFCEKELKHSSFVNREQDLGDEGLRKAKLSYHPVRLVEKFRVRMRE